MISPDMRSWSIAGTAKTRDLVFLIRSAEYAKEKYGVKIRVNTNGLANLYYGRDVIPELAAVVDCVSISLNRADSGRVYGGDPAEIRSCI